MILDEETNHRPLFMLLSSIKAPTLERRKPKERRVHKVHQAWTLNPSSVVTIWIGALADTLVLSIFCHYADTSKAPQVFIHGC
jgi:hypothetical protein